jgi:hypothetical protein
MSKTMIAATATTFGLALATTAMAVPSPLVPGVNNRIDYNNWEYVSFNTTVGAPDTVSVGDRYRGVIQAQNIGDGPSGPVIKSVLPGSGNPSLTGVFEIEVKAINVIAPGVISEIYFGPSTSGWNTSFGLPSGTMIAFYSDANYDFNPALGSDAAVETPIVDGSLIGAFGFGVDDGNPATFADGFFITALLGDPVAQLPQGSPQFFYGLQLLGGAIDPAEVIGQTNPYIQGGPGTQSVVQNLTYSLVGRGQNSTLTTGHYTIFSQDPALIHILGIPEPMTATLGGLSLGALGLAALRRRRVQA